MTKFTGAIRIEEVEISKCPVCGAPIIGALDIDIAFGSFKFAQAEGAHKVDVAVSARPSIVGARIEHYCSQREETSND